MPQASQSPSRAAEQFDAGAAAILRPALAKADLSAAMKLGQALRLAPADAERLASAVMGGQRRPAVAASLLGLAGDDEIAAAMANLCGAPLWEGPAASASVLPSGLNAKFLAENYAMVLADDGEGPVIGLVDPSAPDLRRGIEYALGKPAQFRTISFEQWRSASPTRSG